MCGGIDPLGTHYKGLGHLFEIADLSLIRVGTALVTLASSFSCYIQNPVPKKATGNLCDFLT